MIWYSHVNEDNEVERTTLNNSSTLVCIAGSGERLISLLDNTNLKKVYAIDTNIEALYLLKLKLIALRELSIKDYLGFLGFTKMSSKKRLQYFDLCLSLMDNPEKKYWIDNVKFIKKGVVNCGHFEQFITKVRPFLRLFLGKSFYTVFENDYRKIPKIRWKIVKFLFSFKWIFQILGNKDFAFVGKGTRVDKISETFQKLIDSKKLHESFMAHLVFKGHLNKMKEQFIPPSVNPAILNIIKDRLTNNLVDIVYFHCDFNEFLTKDLKSNKNEKLYVSMSDLLSFESPDYLIKCLDQLIYCNFKSTAVIVRSYLKNQLEKKHLDQIKLLGYLYKNLSQNERTGMYDVYYFNKI